MCGAGAAERLGLEGPGIGVWPRQDGDWWVTRWEGTVEEQPGVRATVEFLVDIREYFDPNLGTVFSVILCEMRCVLRSPFYLTLYNFPVPGILPL